LTYNTPHPLVSRVYFGYNARRKRLKLEAQKVKKRCSSSEKTSSQFLSAKEQICFGYISCEYDYEYEYMTHVYKYEY